MVVIAEIHQATNPQFPPHHNEGLTWLHQLRKPQLITTPLSYWNTWWPKRFPFKFKRLLRVSSEKVGLWHWLNASCTLLLRIYPSDRCRKHHWPLRACSPWRRYRSFDWLLGRRDHALGIFHSISVSPTRTAITVWSFAKCLKFCSRSYSNHPEDVQGLLNESYFSLPGLWPVHRKVFSDL